VVRPTRRAMLVPRRRVERVRLRVERPTRRMMLAERFRERRKKRIAFMEGMLLPGLVILEGGPVG
jgi:hypothetical protein